MEFSAAAAAAGIGAHVFCWTETVVHLRELLRQTAGVEAWQDVCRTCSAKAAL